jgi:hypothetical protein
MRTTDVNTPGSDSVSCQPLEPSSPDILIKDTSQSARHLRVMQKCLYILVYRRHHEWQTRPQLSNQTLALPTAPVSNWSSNSSSLSPTRSIFTLLPSKTSSINLPLSTFSATCSTGRTRTMRDFFSAFASGAICRRSGDADNDRD